MQLQTLPHATNQPLTGGKTHMRTASCCASAGRHSCSRGTVPAPAIHADDVQEAGGSGTSGSCDAGGRCHGFVKVKTTRAGSAGGEGGGNAGGHQRGPLARRSGRRRTLPGLALGVVPGGAVATRHRLVR